jgi:hypothetical protein
MILHEAFVSATHAEALYARYAPLCEMLGSQISGLMSFYCFKLILHSKSEPQLGNKDYLVQLQARKHD